MMDEIEKEAERFIEALIKGTSASVIVPKPEYDRLKQLEAENARLKEFEQALMDMTTEASIKLGSLELAIIPNDEYKKLKKLDENVRNKIDELKQVKHMLSDGADYLLRSLESLLND